MIPCDKHFQPSFTVWQICMGLAAMEPPTCIHTYAWLTTKIIYLFNFQLEFATIYTTEISKIVLHQMTAIGNQPMTQADRYTSKHTEAITIWFMLHRLTGWPRDDPLPWKLDMSPNGMNWQINVDLTFNGVYIVIVWSPRSTLKQSTRNRRLPRLSTCKLNHTLQPLTILAHAQSLHHD